eukprot:12973265-Alexandrium_andersonii.AAC.1
MNILQNAQGRGRSLRQLLLRVTLGLWCWLFEGDPRQGRGVSALEAPETPRRRRGLGQVQGREDRCGAARVAGE